MLQVTVGNRAIVFDLNDEAYRPIPAISEVPAIQDYMNPEAYIESAVMMTQAKRKKYKVGRMNKAGTIHA